MRLINFLVFLSIFLLIVGDINFYVFIRGLQSIARGSGFRKAYSILFWAVAASFFAGRTLESYWPSFLSTILIWVGSFWFAALLYFFLAVLLLDILRLINRFIPFFPPVVTGDYPRAKRRLARGIACLTGLLILGGYINATLPKVKTLNLKVEKQSGNIKELNIVMASDIHLGTLIGKSRLSRIVDRINELNPDIVLFPGDIVDEDLTSIKQNSVGEAFRRIRARYGVYASTGNHEYYGGIEKASRYLTEHGIRLLRDEAIPVADKFYLVGREDRSVNRSESGKERKKLSELMQDVDNSYAVILMDHQPFHLEEAADCGVDLQISGHTHYGQLWPICYIVRSIYELAWGYKKIGDTHYYVSNGVGTWGPPVRIGNRPEIVNIKLSFK